MDLHLQLTSFIPADTACVRIRLGGNPALNATLLGRDVDVQRDQHDRSADEHM